MNSRVLWKTPCPQPNGLQASPDGLWVMDQADDRIYELSYEDGHVLHSFQTQARHASGIALDPEGGVWAASTYGFELIRYDPWSGDVLTAFPNPGDPEVGPHGLEWRDGALWANVPKTQTVYQLDPRDGAVLHRFPAPGSRPHGMAWEDGYLASAGWAGRGNPVGPLPGPKGGALAPRPGIWCVESNHRAIHLVEATSGKVLDEVKVDGPEPHGMTLWRGQFWLCEAATREVFVVDVPERYRPG